MKYPWEHDEKEKPLSENTDEELAAERERIRENKELDKSEEWE